jgi:ABC-type uncharacterized transport system substrate-binding protein
MRVIRKLLLLLALSLPVAWPGFISPVAAHPHVFILARSELIYDNAGRLAAVKHHWTFDEAFSSFAVQGLDSKKDGTYTREDLADLAKTNVESLSEFDYFSFGKALGKKLQFTDPQDYWLDYGHNKLTLNFTLSLREPVPGRTVTFEVYDPTYYVAFTFNGPDAVSLVGAPQGCRVSMKEPPKFDTGSTNVSEDFFNQLSASADFGANFATHALIICP